MNQNRKEEIVELIKSFCDKCVEDITFDEMDIKFKTVEHNVFQGGFRIGNAIQINNEITLSNKKDDFCFSVSGDADSETLAKYAIAGYIKAKNRFIKDKNKREAEERYQKEHPFLSLFKS